MRRKIVCQWPKRALEERLVRRCDDEPIDPPVERVELFDRHFFAPLAQGTSDMHHLMAVRRSGTLSCQPDYETIHVAPQPQQDTLAGEIDRRDLQTLPRANNDERIGRKPADRLMHY
jgi:hypothetical protein